MAGYIIWTPLRLPLEMTVNYLLGFTMPLKAPMVPQVKLKVHAQMVGMLQTFVFQKMAVGSGHYLKIV